MRRYKGCCVLFFISLSLFLATDARLVNFVCEDGWTLEGTHCYWFVSSELGLQGARETCKDFGSKLLMVRDEVEAMEIGRLAMSNFTGQSHFWIGNGYDMANATLMDSPQLFNEVACEGFWQVNQPAALDGHVGVASNMMGRWKVEPAWNRLPFICRTPACPESDFRCFDGECLNSRWKCDGFSDCKDFSDEIECPALGSEFHKASSGSFSSGNYDNTAVRQWVIQGGPGEVLKLTIDSLDIESGADILRVYSGGRTIRASKLLQEFSEPTVGSVVIRGINNFFIVRLLSDGSVTKGGVSAHWELDTERQSTVAEVAVTNVETVVYSITTPVKTPPYKREWLFTTAPGQIIMLTATAEKGWDIDEVDLVTVNQGLRITMDKDRLIYLSNTNEFRLIAMDLDGMKKLSLSAIQGCSLPTTNLSSGLFELTDLPKNIDCSFALKSFGNTSFHFNVFNTTFDDAVDHLEIFSGSSSAGTLIYRANSTVDETEEKPFFPTNDELFLLYNSSITRPRNKVNIQFATECPDLSSPNIQRNDEAGRKAGESYSVNITCELGYSFVQEEYARTGLVQATCNKDGMWDWGSESYTRMPTCQIVYCGLPPTINNGVLNVTSGAVTNGSTVSYECFRGFRQTGPEVVTCSPDGTWTERPTCEADTCSDIPPVENGSYNFSVGDADNSFGTILEFSCDDGYEILGAQRIVCNNRTWSHDPPTCIPQSCQLEMIYKGELTWAEQGSRLPLFGEIVTLTCEAGFVVNRTGSKEANLTCAAGRQLSVTDGDICVDMDECQKPDICVGVADCINTVGGYKCVCQPGYGGDNCTDIDECEAGTSNCAGSCSDEDGGYMCSCPEEGTVLYTQNGTSGFYIPAEEDGMRAGDVYYVNHTCVPSVCIPGDSLNLTNGMALVAQSRYLYNDTVYFACDFGYMLSDNDPATCESNGTFDLGQSAPQCQELTCMQPASDVLGLEAFRVPQIGNIMAGQTLIIGCMADNGSGEIGNRTLHCAPDPNDPKQFILQGDDPICPVVDCGDPWPIPGSMPVTPNTTRYGGTFEFMCDSSIGFTQNMGGVSALGNQTVQCLNSGRWGYGNLTCEGPRCPDPGTKAGTQQVKTSYEIDQIVTYTCVEDGFTPTPPGPLMCEFVGGEAKWNGTAPVCIDTTPPSFDYCPPNMEVNLYDEAHYMKPNASDNSGYVCVTRESGPPSGVVRGNDTSVSYKASDGVNEVYCRFSITVRVTESSSNLTCGETALPNIDLKGESSLMIPENVTGLSQEATYYWPPSPVDVTVGELLVVRYSDDTKECAQVAQVFSTSCKESSVMPVNAQKNCSGDAGALACDVTCDGGYMLQNESTVARYSCSNGSWTPSLPALQCLELTPAQYFYSVVVNYLLSDVLAPFPDECAGNQSANLATRIEAAAPVCKSYKYRIKGAADTRGTGPNTASSTFEMEVTNSDGNLTALKDCVTEIRAHSTELFGASPNVADCKTPWTVQNIGTLTAPDTFSCNETKSLTNEDGITKCLPCGPGNFYNSSGGQGCLQCADGTFQNREGQLMCEQCPEKNGVPVERSSLPRVSAAQCAEVCPEGFYSADGYVSSGCKPCPLNHFWKTARLCEPCPNSGSTKGVFGAINSSFCFAPCMAGMYSDSGFEPCSSCPVNFYAEDMNNTACTECPPDRYTNSNGSDSASDCSDDLASICPADFCNAMNTKPGTNCFISDHRPTCDCKEGYFGDRCDTVCNSCAANPCYNEGTCKQDGLSYECTCKPQCIFEPRNLTYDDSIIPSEVASQAECENLCLDDADCVAYLYSSVGSKNYCFRHSTVVEQDFATVDQVGAEKICDYTSLFNGTRCENDLTMDCTDSTCDSAGVCRDLINKTECVCPREGSYDDRCEKPADLCENDPCVNGDCFSYDAVRFVCECPPGYTGDTCDDNINDCKTNECLYNGTCEDAVDGYTCTCLTGFDGDWCEKRANFCDNAQCGPGGVCYNDYFNLTAVCMCPEHYENEDIDKCTPVKYCAGDPCKYNGTCMDKIGGFQCTCQDGFEGSVCQHNIDECASNPCKNGSSCKDQVNGYRCECAPGFQGVDCSDNINDCTGVCAENTSIGCTDLVENFKCICKPGYMGQNCTEEIDECKSEPCLHGGQCTDQVNGYVCKCLDGWTGKQCETPDNYCQVNNPCSNNGTCHNLMDRTYCQCLDGTAGETCELFKDICDLFGSSLCQNSGQCKSGNGTAQCDCETAYSGDSCELEKDHCSARACGFGACKLDKLSFVCECEKVKDKGGDTCQAPINACDSVTCPADATCVTYTDAEGYQKYECVCQANATVAGGVCKETDRNFDLAFTRDFSMKDTWLRSQRGFDLSSNNSLTVAIFVVNLEPESADPGILALARSEDANDIESEAFLLLTNDELRLGKSSDPNSRRVNITAGKTTDERKWHMVVISWRQDEQVELTFDFSKVGPHVVRISPPESGHVFVYLGNKFSGYISQVSVWNTALDNSEALKIYGDSSKIPKPDDLLLGWTPYEYHPLVYVQPKQPTITIYNTTACSFPATIASSDLCPDVFGKKEKPRLTMPEKCGEELLFKPAREAHQVPENDLLKLTFQDGATEIQGSGNKGQAFTFGAYDIAVSAKDSDGNVGVCMTRAYITSQECKDTEPTENVEDCSDFEDGKKVKCPTGQQPSVPTPAYVRCGALQSYNLNKDMEYPPRIVCGESSEGKVTVTVQLSYTVQISCNTGSIKSGLADKVKELIQALARKWDAICLPSVDDCLNVDVSAECGATSDSIIVTAVLNNLSPILTPTGLTSRRRRDTEAVSMGNNRTAMEVLMEAVHGRTDFDASDIGGAQLQVSTTQFSEVASCAGNRVLIGANCVTCGPGSYYSENATCELCERGSYTSGPNETSCTKCSDSKTTLQAGSNSDADCVENCSLGSFYNVTSGSCQQCFRNFYQDESGRQYCHPCPVSHGTEQGGANSSSLCVSFCDPGFEIEASGCVECERGYFREGVIQDQCKKCPDSNFTTRGNGSTSQDDCNIPVCPPGQYVNHTVSDTYVCQDCDYGLYQDEEAQFSCKPCQENYTTDNVRAKDSSMCRFVCPPGHEESPANSMQCKRCPRGTYRGDSLQERFQNCTECPLQNTTDGDGKTSAADCYQAACDAGDFLNATENVCEPCGYGTYQPDKWQSGCLNCNQSFSTLTKGSTSSADCKFTCPEGQEEYPPNSETCRECPRGYYRNDSLSTRFENCTKCGDEFTTIGAGSVSSSNCSIRICEAGSYRNETDNLCYDCPIGFYQSERLQDSCMACPANQSTVDMGSEKNSSCKYTCPAGYEVNDSQDGCVACPRGTYKNSSMPFGMCMNCSDSMFTTVGETSTSADQCNIKVCSKGYILSASNQDCIPCGLDTYQDVDLPVPSTECQTCKNGKGTVSKASTAPDDCKVFCSAGQGFNSTTSSCENCQRGYWNNGNSSLRFESCQSCPEDFTTEVLENATDIANCSLRDCPPGSFFDTNNDDDCTLCPVGSYQPLPRQRGCMQCPINKNTSGDGAVNANECTVFCQAGQEERMENCTSCKEDFFKELPGFGPCTACTGDYTSTEDDRSACNSLFCDYGRGYSNGSCQTCAQGFFKDSRGNFSCQQCPGNTTTIGEGSRSDSDCSQVFCVPGFYSPDNVTCAPCPMASYKNVSGNHECTACEDRITTAGIASTKASDCYLKICEIGQARSDSNVCEECEIAYYQDEEGQEACKKCPNDTTTLQKGSTVETDCRVVCDPGYFRNDSINECMPCPIGQFQGSKGSNSCIPCGENQTTDQEASATDSDCRVTCPVGYFRENSATCKPCAVGDYQPSFDQESCLSCGLISGRPASTFNMGSESQSDCFPKCEAGKYLIRDSRTCQECAVGTYKSFENLDTKCQPCGNLTTASTGATGPDFCQFAVCDRGHYRPSGSETCSPCPEGTYRNDTTLRNATMCMNCPGGFTTLITGATDPDRYCIVECGNGLEFNISMSGQPGANETSSACIPCPVGQFRDASTSKVCRYCPAGQTTLSEGQSSCISTSIPPPSVTTVQVTVVAVVVVTSCNNRLPVVTKIREIFLQLIATKRQSVNGLCPDPQCSNVIVDTSNICPSSRRKRRSAGNEVDVTVTVNNVDSLLQDSVQNTARTAKAVVEEAVYDLTGVQEDLITNGIEVASAQALTSCYAGSETSSIDPNVCERCAAGSFSTAGSRCQLCTKGSYSVSAGSTDCTSCPEFETTRGPGAYTASNCSGPCAFETSYCGQYGQCQTNSADKSVCVCDSKHTGPDCSVDKLRESPDEDNTTLVAAICGGVGGFLLLVGIIVGCVSCMRRKAAKGNGKSSKDKSLVSETEFVDYRMQGYNNNAVMLVDPTMYNMEMQDFYDSEPANRENGFSSRDGSQSYHGDVGLRRSGRPRDW
ncbi:uncharacterized protein LOC101855048 [Aplysia californica]|uniref:Uncharacterized protein LOC101855048 n=1 Tax=Aplysia californica TaxID=6500 RepID=A0ABM1A851_APLCA|nr:uncharacterized protein LOC101855048 [Aplysia californica]